MSNSTYFSQECPTCGRNLLIRVEYLGKQVVCQHCRGRLCACDPANTRIDDGEYSSALLRRAEELIESVDRRGSTARAQNPK